MTIDTKWLIIGGIIAAILGALVTGLFMIWAKRVPEAQPPIRPSQSAASIEQPISRQIVERSFTVSGSLGEIPQGYHIWLGVEIDNLLWPKEPEVPSTDRRFFVNIEEGGDPPNAHFSLVLFQVSNEGNKRIVNWFDNGRRTGDWPGLDPGSLEGFARLDRADDLSLL